ncbi:MAG: histidine kinase [Crocinitomicaceae bacterium]|nr:histidine kinase [Crocinitomicaceae bacterium]
MNPHFLFNSLNSIRALVGINPDQAKSALHSCQACCVTLSTWVSSDLFH